MKIYFINDGGIINRQRFNALKKYLYTEEIELVDVRPEVKFEADENDVVIIGPGRNLDFRVQYQSFGRAAVQHVKRIVWIVQPEDQAQFDEYKQKVIPESDGAKLAQVTVIPLEKVNSVGTAKFPDLLLTKRPDLFKVYIKENRVEVEGVEYLGRTRSFAGRLRQPAPAPITCLE